MCRHLSWLASALCSRLEEGSNVTVSERKQHACPGERGEPLSVPVKILFPHQPFEPRRVDDAFSSECAAARALGFDACFYSHEAVVAGEWGEALRPLRRLDGEEKVRLLLRGWMLSGEQYAALHARLEARGYTLLTSPAAYEEAHYLPLAYPHIEGFTARSEWILGDDEEEAWALYHGSFRGKDALIKDWVKSAKYHWKDGCFIPANTSRERFREIFGVFRQARGTLFNRGVVLREYLSLVKTGGEMRGIPVIDEVRLFFFRGELVVVPGGDQEVNPMQHRARWERIAGAFQSDFMTMDVALREDGEWAIIEVGDGGVSGLPETLDPTRFYASLWNAML